MIALALAGSGVAMLASTEMWMAAVWCAPATALLGWRWSRGCNQPVDTAATAIARSLERDLGKALARGEFTLHYQPQYDCRTLGIASAEALLRWRHPQRGMVSPSEFIPLAEKSNLICDIGQWVVGEATRTIARFEQLGLPLRISVNVSPRQLEDAGFVGMIRTALAASGAAPNLLEVELTESMAMHDRVTAAASLKHLAELGISIAIDDFGTGYSNLACLIRLPVSRLKIDRSLLQGLTSRPEVQTLARTIISLASGLGFHTVAEGIESADQLHLLTDMGCDVVQGFYLSRPVDESALERRVTADRNATDRPFEAVAC